MVGAVLRNMERGSNDDGCQQGQPRSGDCYRIRCVWFLEMWSCMWGGLVSASVEGTRPIAAIWHHSQGAPASSGSDSSVGQELAGKNHEGMV